MIDEKDIIFKTILRCVKNVNKPDLHSFTVRIKGGLAYVEAQYAGAVMVDTNTGDCKHTYFVGTPIAAANRLEMFGADPHTIET